MGSGRVASVRDFQIPPPNVDVKRNPGRQIEDLEEKKKLSASVAQSTCGDARSAGSVTVVFAKNDLTKVTPPDRGIREMAGIDTRGTDEAKWSKRANDTKTPNKKPHWNRIPVS